MGNSEGSIESIRKQFIQPVPGSYGGGVKRKGHIMIYTDKQVLTYRYNSQMLVADIKQLLQENLGYLYRLYLKDRELDDSLTLEESEVPDASMIRAVAYTSFHTSSTKSLSADAPKKLRDDLDLSKYSVPDIGKLKNLANNEFT